MRLPKDLDIFGHLVIVSVCDIGESYDGLYHSEEDLIEIHKRLRLTKKDIAFIHEFLHAVHDKASLIQAIPDGVAEIIVDMTAKALVKNFILTPRVRKKKK